MKLKVLGLIGLVMIFLAACSSAAQQGSNGPVDAGSDLPPIQAGDCTLRIEGVQVSDRYPPDCVPGSKNCLQMNDNEQLLLVFFKPEGMCNLEGLTDKIAFEKDLYLLAIDGTRSERIITGVEGGVFGLGFSLASPPSNLLLIWGDNPKIKLPSITP